MTAKKDLKKRIRARQRHSGERYTTALEQVKAEARRPRVEIVVLNEISDQARAAGLGSRVYASSALWALRSAKPERDLLLRTVLDRLAEVLRVTESDASTALLRRALVHGKTMPPLPRVLDLKRIRAFHAQRLAFRERLRLGVRGTSEDGRAIAFEAPDPGGEKPLVLVAMLSQTHRREPVTYLTLASECLAQKESFQDVSECSFRPSFQPEHSYRGTRNWQAPAREP